MCGGEGSCAEVVAGRGFEVEPRVVAFLLVGDVGGVSQLPTPRTALQWCLAVLVARLQPVRGAMGGCFCGRPGDNCNLDNHL